MSCGFITSEFIQMDDKDHEKAECLEKVEGTESFNGQSHNNDKVAKPNKALIIKRL